MNKKLSLILIGLLCSGVSAQLRDTRFGLIGGLTQSRVQNAHNPSGTRTGFYGGVTALTPINQSPSFFIQTQLEYLQGGEEGNEGKNKYHNNYISLPIYFKAYFSEAESEFFGLIGPRFAYLLNQKVEENPMIIRPVFGQKIPINYPEYYGKANSIDIAISAGIGYSYERKYEAVLRADWGITSAFHQYNRAVTGDPLSDNTKRQIILTAGFNYVF